MSPVSEMSLKAKIKTNYIVPVNLDILSPIYEHEKWWNYALKVSKAQSC